MAVPGCAIAGASEGQKVRCREEVGSASKGFRRACFHARAGCVEHGACWWPFSVAERLTLTIGRIRRGMSARFLPRDERRCSERKSLL